MYKFVVIIATLCFAASVSAGLIETHHVVHQPVLAKVGAVVHTHPSAVSHQSITQVHSKAIVQPVFAPVVKTTVHHAAPLVHVHAAPLLHSVPVVHSVPVLHSAPVVNSSPLVKTVVAAPVAYSFHH